MNDKALLVQRLRHVFRIPNEFSDEKVLEITKGSFVRANIELKIAGERFIRALAQLIRRK